MSERLTRRPVLQGQPPTEQHRSQSLAMWALWAKQQQFLKRNNRALAVWGRNNNNDLCSNHTFCFFFESPTHIHYISSIHQRPASSPILQMGREVQGLTNAVHPSHGTMNRTFFSTQAAALFLKSLSQNLRLN